MSSAEKGSRPKSKKPTARSVVPVVRLAVTPPPPSKAPSPPPSPAPSTPSKTNMPSAMLSPSADAQSPAAPSYASATKRYVHHIYLVGLPEHAVPSLNALEKLLLRINSSTPLDIASLSFPVTHHNQRSASLRSYRPDIIDTLKKYLCPLIGEPIAIENKFVPRASPSTTSSTNATARLPSFSCVLRNVNLDITAITVKEAAASQNINIYNALRITSRATNKPTRLVRIFSHSKEAIDALLTNGLLVGLYRLQAEPSLPPAPRPSQCHKCVGFHPPSQHCELPLTCGLCAGKHHTNSCTSKTLKCASCGSSEHTAFSNKCPTKQEKAKNVTDSTAFPPRFSPIPDNSDPDTKLAYLLLAVLSKLFPTRIASLQSAVTEVARELLGSNLAFTHSSGSVHLTCMDRDFPLLPDGPLR